MLALKVGKRYEGILRLWELAMGNQKVETEMENYN